LDRQELPASIQRLGEEEQEREGEGEERERERNRRKVIIPVYQSILMCRG